MNINRERELNDLGTIAMFANLSLSLPQELVYGVEGLSVFTGLGEDERVIQPIKRYWQHEKSKNRFLLVPGYNQAEKTWKDLTIPSLVREPFNLKRIENVHVMKSMGTTKDQAIWIVEKIKELSIKECAIISSPFHLLRAYVTTMSVMLAAGIRIPLIPVPILISPGEIVAEIDKDAWSLVQGEAERIIAYQKKGDIVLHEEFKDYINWLWQEPFIKNFT